MNDSRTLELYKSGQYIRALARTTMYGFGVVLGLVLAAIVTLPLLLLAYTVILAPILLALMNIWCGWIWQ